MKFKSFGLLLLFIEECGHAWSHISYLNWENKISDIRYHTEKKLWYLYLPVTVGPHAPYMCLVVTDDGNTIYNPDCVTRLVYNGNRDKCKAWDCVDNDDATYDMVSQLMINDKF